MKVSTISWVLTAVIVVAGLSWYVYANSAQSAYDTEPTQNTAVTTGPGPGYDGADMMPISSTPIASSTPKAATTTGTAASTSLKTQ